VIGDPSTAANEADLVVQLRMTDVRQTTLADYPGELQLNAQLRITDRFNSASPGGGTNAATVVDLPFPTNVQCVVTGDPSVGSTCAVDTTFNAVIPGAVKEGKRAIWALDQLHVVDGGADGVVATVPNTLFAIQGVFVP
jgi:hypothetical protein